MGQKPYGCIDCGEKNPEKFYPREKRRCKSCSNIFRVRRRKLNPANKERQSKYYKRWYAERGRKRDPAYKDVIILWQSSHRKEIEVERKVAEAIRKGLLERPLKCFMCGEIGRINAHHSNYDFPYNVIWICSSCHKKVHSLKEVMT